MSMTYRPVVTIHGKYNALGSDTRQGGWWRYSEPCTVNTPLLYTRHHQRRPVRVSTDEQATSGLGLAAQLDPCTPQAIVKGWIMQHLFCKFSWIP
jgi:hypothetical protein